MRGIRRGVRLALAVALTVAAPARAAPAWFTPATVSPAGTSASAPNIALTPGGETIAAWVRSGVVEVAVRPPGGAFGASAAVSYEGADSASAPDLAVAPDGRALVTWRDRCDADRLSCVTEAIMRGPGGTFSAPVTLSDQGAGPPRGVFTSDGRAVVAWERRVAGSGFNIESAVSSPGGGFSAPAAVVDSSSIDVSSPDLATDGTGRAFLVWGAATSGPSASVPNAALRLAVLPAGGAGWSTPSELWTQDSSVDQSVVDTVAYASPAIAADRSGNAAVLWVRVVVHYESGLQPTVTTTIQALSRAADGTVTNPQDIDTGVSVTGFSTSLSAPDIAADSLGDMVTVWTMRNSGTATTTVRRAARLAGQRSFGPVSSPVSGANDAAPAAGSASVAPLGQGAMMLGFLQAGVVRAAVAQGGGAFSTPVAVSAPGAGLSVPHFAGDTAGDAVGVWSMQDGNAYRTQVSFYDATPPELRQVQAPATAVVGESVAFSVSPFDAWSGVGTSWSFGDGTATAAGGAVAHAFARAGDYTVTLAAFDGVGNTTTTTRRVAVRKPDHVAPKITALRLTRPRFAIAARATAVSAGAHRGTTIRFTLSERATVRLYIKRVLAGHRIGHKCATGAGAGRSCSVYRAVGKLVRRTGRGRRKVPFTGRIGASPLRPGRYRLTVIAKDSAGNTSKPARARFTVIRP